MSDVYQIKIGNSVADPYRIALAYGLDPVIAQAVKKLLRCGRKHKDLACDVREAITTLERWEAIQLEIKAEASQVASRSLRRTRPSHSLGNARRQKARKTDAETHHR
jgi:hypothetical protein